MVRAENHTHQTVRHIHTVGPPESGQGAACLSPGWGTFFGTNPNISSPGWRPSLLGSFCYHFWRPSLLQWFQRFDGTTPKRWSKMGLKDNLLGVQHHRTSETTVVAKGKHPSLDRFFPPPRKVHRRHLDRLELSLGSRASAGHCEFPAESRRKYKVPPESKESKSKRRAEPSQVKTRLDTIHE